MPNIRWFVTAGILLALWWFSGSLVGFLAVLLLALIDLVLTGTGFATPEKAFGWQDTPFLLMLVGVLAGGVVLAVQHLE
jgi:hypothetical protein